MYFPYLRGRQFELLALKELIQTGQLSKNIIPIIEPVKLSSSLTSTIKLFLQNEQEIAVIHNPKVGYFFDEINLSEKDKIRNDFFASFYDNHVIKAHIINQFSAQQIDLLELNHIQKNELLIVNNDRDTFSVYEDIFKNETPRFILIPDESTYRRRVKSNKVLFHDPFTKQLRNANYSHTPDEFFSDDHQFYLNDGYLGFADYSVIGNAFTETGFAPYAVAIHIIYLAPDGSLRIAHFVSDSNEDISNPAKKFYEAVEKLNQWVNDTHPTITRGLDGLLSHYRNETYPGLGSIKKYSIMHHLELMSNILN